MLKNQNTLEQAGRRHRTRLLGIKVVVVLSVFGLTACQTDGPPVLSLEEAKQATASFEGQAFVPPPKTIDDITEILKTERHVNPEELKRNKRLAGSSPPSGGSSSEQAQFYFDRALAFGELGDTKRMLADLKTGLPLSRGLSRLESDILFELGKTQSFLGDYKSAIVNYKRGVVLSESPVIRRALMANILTVFGDLKEGERQLEIAEAGLSQATGRRFEIWKVFVDRAKASVLTSRGQYAEGEEFARSALQGFDNITMSREASQVFLTANTHAALARNLQLQGRSVEAEIEIRKSLQQLLKRFGRNSGRTANAIGWFAQMLSAQGRHSESASLARSQLDIYRAQGAPSNSLKVAFARGLIADALVAQKKWAAAVAEFGKIEQALHDDKIYSNQFFGAKPMRPIAFLMAGHVDKGVQAAQQIERWYRFLGREHYDYAEAAGILAMAQATSGQHQEALSGFTQSVPILLQSSRRSNRDGTSAVIQDWRLRLILESYLSVLERLGGSGMAEHAFQIAQSAQGQSVQRALSANAARAAVKSPALADLVRREQDSLKRIGALNGLLGNAVNASPDRQNRAEVAELRERIDTLLGARAALAQEIERRFPDYAALMNPKPATITRARARLSLDEALIATYVAEDRTYVWAAQRNGPIKFSASPLSRGRLTKEVRYLRRSLDPQAATLGDIPRFDVGRSYELYKSLLAPVAEGWRGAKSLLVVAHGPLGQLPFSVLVSKRHKLAKDKSPLFSNYRDVPFLARSHAVTVVPSVASFVTLRGLPQAAPTRRNFAGFGDPWFNERQAQAATVTGRTQQIATAVTSRGLLKVRGLPLNLRSAPKLDGVTSADLAKLPRLEDTADEVKSIALAMNADLTRDVFIGRRASEGRVKSMSLSGYKVVAFATHGLVPGDLNGLTQPALALSSPRVVGGKEDGLLTMGEVLGLKLDADWVVLSACNTASGNGAGAEAVSGLGRAFFYAGTRALLVSNWPVETTSARALTTDIFGRQAKNTSLKRSDALRQSMLKLIDKGGLKDAKSRTMFSYAHPIFWAPFSLVGDGGGGEISGVTGYDTLRPRRAAGQ
jgi:CHAT domain-containing protein